MNFRSIMKYIYETSESDKIEKQPRLIGFKRLFLNFLLLFVYRKKKIKNVDMTVQERKSLINFSSNIPYIVWWKKYGIYYCLICIDGKQMNHIFRPLLTLNFLTLIQLSLIITLRDEVHQITIFMELLVTDNFVSFFTFNKIYLLNININFL